jgi:cell division transport system permease protein
MKNALAGIERSLFWTLAFAAFAAAAAGLAARAVDRVADAYEAQRHSYAIVRVIAPEGPAGLAAAESVLAAAPLVASAAPMSASRAAALLGEWGGAPVRAEDIPPLRLIEIELAPGAAPADAGDELTAALAQGGITAELVTAPAAASGGGVARRVTLAAGWGAAAFALVMALIVALGARTLAARRRELVAVMADLGATRGQAAGRIGDEAAFVGLYAGAVGAALAGCAAFALLFLLLPDLSLAAMADLILPIDAAPLLAVPLGAALAAGLGARAAASLFYARAARLA